MINILQLIQILNHLIFFYCYYYTNISKLHTLFTILDPDCSDKFICFTLMCFIFLCMCILFRAEVIQEFYSI